MNWEAMKPLAAWAFRIVLNAVGVFLMSHGAIKDGAGMEMFLGMATSAGTTFWSWWVTDGHIQAAKFLQNVTQTATAAAAVEVAKRMQYTPAVANAATDAKASVAAAKAIAPLILLAVVLGMLAFPGGAHAQVKLVKPTGNIVQDIAAATGRTAAGTATSAVTDVMSAIAKPFQDLADFIGSDAEGAADLATVVPNLQDTNGKACWTKMQDAGAVFKAHPVPLTFKAMTDFEALRLLQMTANNLCAYTPCTVVFSDGANLVVAAASAVGGALTSNAVPSLTQLCARIPQLSPMLPLAVTAPAAK